MKVGAVFAVRMRFGSSWENMNSFLREFVSASWDLSYVFSVMSGFNGMSSSWEENKYISPFIAG